MNSNRRPLQETVERLRASRGHLPRPAAGQGSLQKEAAEGGCGVIGIASSEAIAGRHLLRSLRQMRNRGNGKGGGAALAGLDPDQFGVDQQVLRESYLLAIAYLDPTSRASVEASHIRPAFEIIHVHEFPREELDRLETPPPLVAAYFVRPHQKPVDEFASRAGLEDSPRSVVEDEFVYQNSYALNHQYYASLGEQQAFVLSHGKDLLALKMVGYGDDVIETYALEAMRAHVWIGHHRYPTKGRVWHPGGAHPFVGLHEALVHNGDFANYASVCTYLAQENIHPLFLTDTEVSVLVFDLHHRTYGYPLEYVIESLAPTTERDYAMLPPEKQAVYRRIQATHMHGSPDGPWFFLIAQSVGSERGAREPRLIGITDTSMLRPQVFALQRGLPGGPSIGFAASEKQAIDAALESLAEVDQRIQPRADLYWNARGGSHTDGGAFIFKVLRDSREQAKLVCIDKFGRTIDIEEQAEPFDPARTYQLDPTAVQPFDPGATSAVQGFQGLISCLPQIGYGELDQYLLDSLTHASTDAHRAALIELLTLLIDRRYPTYGLRRSSLLSRLDAAMTRLFVDIGEEPSAGYVVVRHGDPIAAPLDQDQTLILDARGFPHEGSGSLARAIVESVQAGYRSLILAHTRGHRFIGSGLGPDSRGVTIDVYGSPGDYLGSGLDGAQVRVHASGQDQLAQIMKSGELVVHGDVGQTFMYAAKGGQAYVLGNAAGRPLINAVGGPKVVINGTCLDYLAESFMAGDPFDKGGFVILNGMRFGGSGRLEELNTPYPGGNLFSLASGGAIFVRDPHERVGKEQLNGGTFVQFEDRHWELIRPQLVRNGALFGIEVNDLLTVNGQVRDPSEVYRAIVPVREKALQPEEAWVAEAGSGL